MTSKSMLVQVRMPPRLVQALDRLSEEGIYSNRSEAIVDSVRRLVLAFATKDPFREALVKSCLGRTGTGSIEELRTLISPEDIAKSITETFGTDKIDRIINEVRR
ncbi:MAG: ribbon-helix-helix domain-containing protein [Methanoregula sp.]|nr:ribbon-helix-helix domain-containing protein [Methanoregula sp.]